MTALDLGVDAKGFLALDVSGSAYVTFNAPPAFVPGTTPWWFDMSLFFAESEQSLIISVENSFAYECVCVEGP